jgi:ATP-dependent helicase/nuclease subunit A
MARQRSQPAPGCPAFGEESVLERGPKGKPPAAGSVRPGLHVRAASGAPVVWWDPVVFALEVEALAPLRHQRILEADSDGAAAADSQRNYAAWKTGREALLAKASKPSLSVQTVTSLVRSAATRAAGINEGNGSGSEPRANVERVERGDLERPGGRRFGALVHALLASIDLSADPDAVQAAASVQGRIVGATAQEISAAIVTIGRVLNHPILRRAGSLRRSLAPAASVAAHGRRRTR